MSEDKNVNDEAVDRRAKTVVTEQPGYAATEHVTQDVAAERRQQVSNVDWVVWTLLGILEILLGLRLVLKLIAANANSGFAVFIYGATKFFTAPFSGLLGKPATAEGSIFEVTTLIAMVVYALLFWVIVRVVHIGGNRSSSRTTTSSTHEETPRRPGQ
jgi:hypothetical protein